MNGFVSTLDDARDAVESARLPRRQSQLHLINIRQQIVRNYADSEYSLVALSESLQLSRRYVQRVLAMHHLTFTELLGQIRLAVAAELLVKMDARKRLSQLATECGYKTQSSFNRAFKQHYQVTPRAYRSQRLSEMRSA